MTRVLHLFPRVSADAAGHGVLTLAQHLGRPYRHTVLSLLPADQEMREAVRRAGVSYVHANSDLARAAAEFARHDIVQVYWRASPQLDALLRSDTPPARLALWTRASGLHLPHLLTGALLEQADAFLYANPASLSSPDVQKLLQALPQELVLHLYPPTDFSALPAINRLEDAPFTIACAFDPAAMHPEALALSFAAGIGETRVAAHVTSAAAQELLLRQAAECGVEQRIEIVHDRSAWRDCLASAEVYAWALRGEAPGGTLDCTLQEAMYLGAVPVVLAQHPADLPLQHGETGMVVQSAAEFQEAIVYLYRNPAERRRLSAAARQAAQEHFNPERAAHALDRLYQQLLERPKRFRRWGVDMSRPVLQQQFTAEQLAGQAPAALGRERLIEALGSAAAPFQQSAAGGAIAAAIDGDQAIFESSSGCGAVLELYAQHYQADPFLQLWHGVHLLGQARTDEAVAALQRAEQAGLREWRVHWYAAIAALKQRCWSEAAAALARILETNPSFEPAHVLINVINQHTLVLRRCSLTQIDWAREVPCRAIRGSGFPELFRALIASGRCAYWRSFDETWQSAGEGFVLREAVRRQLAAEWPPEAAARRYRFSDAVAFGLDYASPEDWAGRGTIRLERAAADTAAARITELYSRVESETLPTADDLVDLPLLPDEGGLLGLGAVEEAVLQQRLCREKHKDGMEYVLHLDALCADAPAEIATLCRFADLEPAPAMDAAVVSIAGGSTRTPEIPGLHAALASRAALIEAALQSEAGAAPGAWPEDVLEEAVRGWLRCVRHRLSRIPGSAMLCAGPLRALGRAAERLPLVEVALCGTLLRAQPHRGFAVERLRALALRGPRFVKLLAAALLANHDNRDRRAQQQYQFFREQLDAWERDYIERAVAAAEEFLRS